jgi:hypothetical protein
MFVGFEIITSVTLKKSKKHTETLMLPYHIFDPKGGGSAFLRSVFELLPGYTG